MKADQRGQRNSKVKTKQRIWRMRELEETGRGERRELMDREGRSRWMDVEGRSGWKENSG